MMALNVPSVTPVAGTSSTIATGGTSQQAAPGNINGGFITNPLLAADQGIVTAEPLFIDPTGAAAHTAAGGTTFRLEVGQTWVMIPGQTTSTNVNAATSGHKFTVVYF